MLQLRNAANASALAVQWKSRLDALWHVSGGLKAIANRRFDGFTTPSARQKLALMLAIGRQL